MNLLCPNCQKTLTVPEHYAGQLMKCPLCSGNFTVPTLPPAPELAAPTTASSNKPETYGVRNDPAAEKPQNSVPTPTPASSPASFTEPTSKSAFTSSPSPSPTPSLPPVGYTRAHTLWLSPFIVQYVAPLAVVLLFFLQMFSWVGLYPGGVPVLTQGAWSAAYGFSSKETGAEKLYPYDLKKVEPDGSGFLILYTILSLVTLIVTVAIVVLPHISVKLPPIVERLLPYKWGIAAVLNALVFFFLAVQLLVGFDLENKVADMAVKKAAEEFPGKNLETIDELKKQVLVGSIKGTVRRTFWLTLSVLLHLAAIIGSAMMYWLIARGETRPLPRIEFAC